MKISFNLVEKDPKKLQKKALITLSIIFIFFLTLPFSKQLEEPGVTPVGIFFAILFLTWVAAMLYSNFALVPYKKIGKIVFGDEYIKILNNSLTLRDLEKIKVVYKSIYGEGTGGSFSINFGDGNQLIIIDKQGKVYKYEVLFENISQVLYLQRILKYYHKQGIDVEFYKFNRLIFPKKN